MEGSKTMRTHKRTHRSNSKMGRRAGIGFLSLVMVPLGLFSVLSEDVSTETATPASAAVPAPTEEQLERAYANLPLSFEANLGQTDAQVKFLSRGLGIVPCVVELHEWQLPLSSTRSSMLRHVSN